MAFNFNWSPLIADTSRARDMLTTALNKSPKPPIIVDDIIVTELNLGSVPPELEILEIGDLAEDRFRGIFRMHYDGDAFLTLKTRVQANPLNTYLSTKPSFASPEPLAAASGLTIPLQITLSDIKLSGFVILVFSKQKGITVVFRNDPLESLKVSSTFDSIPFIKNYLQKEIEGQLRVLFMEDLPAIIHRLSLRLWSPEHQSTEANVNSNRVDGGDGEVAVDPLATPSQRPFDATKQPEDPEFPSLSLDSPSSEPYPSFSAKNLLRLAALTDSHRTLSLFTPPVQDVVFRAWAATAERGELSPAAARSNGFTLASLSRQHSTTTSVSSVYSFSDGGMTTASAPNRPTLSSNISVLSGPASTVGGGRRSLHGQRTRKNRVVDLRKKTKPETKEKETEDGPTRTSTPTSSSYGPSSDAALPSSSFDVDDELVTPPDSPEKTTKARAGQQEPSTMPLHSPKPQRVATIRKAHERMVDKLHLDTSEEATPTQQRRHSVDQSSHATIRAPPRLQHTQSAFAVPSSTSSPPSFPYGTATAGGILEQAWMMKMASDIAQKVQSEKNADDASSMSGLKRPDGFWRSSSSEGGESQAPPPAYAV
ncbi:hypothetical protein FH972_022625 [Carpinus fangiana]|uniref:SMP-LTD domain-containing protein n=1 Tax=Carpinus fangiana TaxID=176857 RepID=A0A5N6KTC3_9ROSI|nr:hypothetical protein FH972_022625 [Carpinus fangiana]